MSDFWEDKPPPGFRGMWSYSAEGYRTPRPNTEAKNERLEEIIKSVFDTVYEDKLKKNLPSASFPLKD